ncbi:MAG: hypothetical protein K5779_00895 [Saccharofermentans sp.]|nr:hypothetical protein [Saccharofermentans sp.]
MNGLTIIYIVAALAVGFLIGIITEVFIDADQLRQLTERISKLKMENQALIDGRTEVIEIVDNRVENEEAYHDYFKPF